MLANSPLSPYFEFLKNPRLINFINEDLMFFFFLLIGFEIKKEFVFESHRSLLKVLHPVLSALGGMLFPALVYVLFNLNQESIHAWAIPTATDISLALAVLAIFKNSVPSQLRVFLLSLAVADDLGAIILIALLYQSQIAWVFVLSIIALNISLNFLPKRIKENLFVALAYLSIQSILFLNSHLHSSLFAVFIALSTPKLEFHFNKFRIQKKNILKLLEYAVNFFILPFFIFCNSGVRIEASNLTRIFAEPVFLGVFFGFVLGKSLGISLTSLSFLKLTKATINYKQQLGVSFLAGIGFTMAIFMTELSLSEPHKNFAKLAILMSSISSAAIGMIFFYSSKQQTKT